MEDENTTISPHFTEQLAMCVIQCIKTNRLEKQQNHVLYFCLKTHASHRTSLWVGDQFVLYYQHIRMTHPRVLLIAHIFNKYSKVQGLLLRFLPSTELLVFLLWLLFFPSAPWVAHHPQVGQSLRMLH